MAEFGKSFSSLKEISDFLAQVPLFQNLSDAQRDKLAAICRERAYRRSDTLFIEGRRAGGFFILVDGRVKVFKVSRDGREQILHIFQGGEILGEVPVFAGGTYPAHAEALVDTRALFVPRDGFVRLIQEETTLALNMLVVLSRRLIRFTNLVEDLSLKEVPSRLAAYLLYLMERADGAREVELDMTKGQLASLLGTIPETLSRIFARLAGAGIITINGRRIHILDPKNLTALSQGEKLL